MSPVKPFPKLPIGHVSRSAVVKRLNHKLKGKYVVRIHRADGSQNSVLWKRGDCYLTEIPTGIVRKFKMKLEDFAREQGCLRSYEELVDD